MTNRALTKSLVLSHIQCPKRAWLEFNSSVDPVVTMADQGNLSQGQTVHQCGRSLFAGATKINTLVLQDALEQTQAEIKAGADTLFNATFIAGNLGVIVDVLQKGPTGHRIIDIKSGSEVKDQYLNDCAIQMACLSNAGIVVEGVDVMHPNTKIIRPIGGNGSEVLVTEDVSVEVQYRAMRVAQWVADCEATVNGKMPVCAPSEQCTSPSNCPFSSHCGKPAESLNLDTDLVQFLPSKAGAVKALIAAGVTRITDMPFSAMTNPRNALVYEAIVQDKAIILAEIADFVRDLPFPRSFVDFEAASFAIPRFDGMRSYESLVFQWSCHTQTARDAQLEHTEFLDVTGNDPRRGFIESLLVAVGDVGPVLVFSHYEKTRLTELAGVFPDLRDAILKVIDRLVDVLPIARQGFYAPQMRGSWSLKKISPTLPPCDDLKAYADMGELADGLAAQAAYMNQIDACFIGEQKEIQRKDMLIYCKADTRGLAHFVECLQSACTPVSQARVDIFAMAA